MGFTRCVGVNYAYTRFNVVNSLFRAELR